MSTENIGPYDKKSDPAGKKGAKKEKIRQPSPIEDRITGGTLENQAGNLVYFLQNIRAEGEIR
jgi:hypothetical protein